MFSTGQCIESAGVSFVNQEGWHESEVLMVSLPEQQHHLYLLNQKLGGEATHCVLTSPLVFLMQAKLENHWLISKILNVNVL